MLTIPGASIKHTLCNGISRRDFLRLGSLSLGELGMYDEKVLPTFNQYFLKL